LRRLPIIIALLALSSGAVRAQESEIHADFRGEAARFKKSCENFSLKAIPGCAELLFTDHPLHIAVGSLAPQNGFGAGGAYVGHFTPNELWRTSWDADAIATDNEGWKEFVRGTAIEVHAEFAARASIKGEFTLLVGKAVVPPPDDTPVGDAVDELVRAGAARMDAIKQVARRRGLSKREVYEETLRDR